MIKKTIKINLLTIIIVIIGLVGVSWFGLNLISNKINSLNQKLTNEVKLKNALLDRVNHYQNKENEWVAEKLTMQAHLDDLKKMNNQLTSFQNELVRRIASIEKENKVIAAALIQTNTKIDSLLLEGKVTIDTIKHTVSFNDYYKNKGREFRYGITIGNVTPIKFKQPTLYIDSLYFPNTQFVEFHWKNDRKRGYPIAFSVTNSNDFFKTANVESYAMPNLYKEKIDPNTWDKITMWLNRNSNSLIKFGVGVGTGVLIGAYVF